MHFVSRAGKGQCVRFWGNGRFSLRLEEALIIPHISLPPAPIVSQAQHKGPGDNAVGHLGPVFSAWPWGESPLNSCHTHVMKQSWRGCRGRGPDRVWGLLIRRNMERLLRGRHDLGWVSWTERVKEPRTWRHQSSSSISLHQLRLISTGQTGGETSPSDPQSFLTSGLGAHRWAVLSLVRTTLAPPR